MDGDERQPALEKLNYYAPEPKQSMRKRLNWRGLLLLFGLVAGILAIIAYLQQPVGTPHRIRCQRNLSMISNGLLLYTTDRASRGAYPDDLLPLLVDGEMSPEMFVCPESNDTKATGPTTQTIFADFAKPGRCSYVYRAAGLTTATVTPKHVLAHERLGNHSDPGINVLFGDGSVEWLDADKAKKLIAELDAGHNPPRN